eukprot:CAMPEP_0181427498 /NCGR_PEP_ID=MMETSP1110-20121109/16203_1 /TAXON_ID=174948 /ORGANISM="Symbiodinium sp., Strain CCMP421" /LENGTH=32 /DNA_ID= /DNA_START= /DNA_END= /DNA_ORIENTATION=
MSPEGSHHGFEQLLPLVGHSAQELRLQSLQLS